MEGYQFGSVVHSAQRKSFTRLRQSTTSAAPFAGKS